MIKNDVQWPITDCSGFSKDELIYILGLAIRQLIETWPALRAAVDYGWGGKEGAKTAETFIQTMVEFFRPDFKERGHIPQHMWHHRANSDTFAIWIGEMMLRNYNCDLEDLSHYDISENCFKLFYQVSHRNMDGINFLMTQKIKDLHELVNKDQINKNEAEQTDDDEQNSYISDDDDCEQEM